MLVAKSGFEIARVTINAVQYKFLKARALVPAPQGVFASTFVRRHISRDENGDMARAMLSIVGSISCESSCDVAQGWYEGGFVETEASSSKIPRARPSALFALTHTSIVAGVAPQS